MNRSSLACLLLLGAACSAQNSSLIEIDGRAAPGDAVSCKFTAGGENLLGPGLLDVAVTGARYELVVYVKNNVPDPKVASPDNLTAWKIWYPFAARVRVNPKDYKDSFGPNPALLPIETENTTPLDGEAIQPAGGIRPLPVEAISGPLASVLAMQVAPGEIRRVVLGITLQGRTGDGNSLDSGEWFFPVDLCSGCLVAPSSCATGQVVLPTNCFGNAQDSAPACSTPRT